MKLEIELPNLHLEQKKIINSKALVKIVCAGRQSGKSYTWMYETVDKMLSGKHGGVLTPPKAAAKLHRQFSELDFVAPLISSVNKTTLSIEFKTGGRLNFFSSEVPDNIRTFTFDFFVIDEAAFQHELKYSVEACINPTMATKGIDLTIVSTPNGHDYFYSLFLKGLRKEHDHESFHFTLYDNPFLSAKTRAHYKATTSEVNWNQEWLAIPASGENPFGDTSKHVQPLAEGTPVIYGIDLASKIDYTVITGLNNEGEVCYSDRFKADWPVVIERVRQLPKNIPIVMDSTGVGKVVYETLALERGDIIPFNFTGQSRQQLINKLILSIEQGKIKFTELYHQEMSTLEGNRLKNGDIRYEAKGGFHDDAVMSLALANFHHEQYKISKAPGFYKPKK